MVLNYIISGEVPSLLDEMTCGYVLLIQIEVSQFDYQCDQTEQSLDGYPAALLDAGNILNILDKRNYKNLSIPNNIGQICQVWNDNEQPCDAL